MKKLILFLFFLLPILATAQTSWERVVPQMKTPEKMIATHDGGYVIWGWRTISYPDQAVFAKYDLNGQLLWSKSWQARSGLELTGISGLNEISGGDVWIAGKAIGSLNGKPRKGYTFTQRLNRQTGDTLYNKYGSDTLDLKGLRNTASGPKIYGSGLRDADEIDRSYHVIAEYDENLNHIKDIGYQAEGFSFPPFQSNVFYVNNFYLHPVYSPHLYITYPSFNFHSNPDFHSNSNPPKVTYVRDYHIIDQFPSGELLISGINKIAVYDVGAKNLMPFPENLFSLQEDESRLTPLAAKDGNLLVPGTYQYSSTQRALFLMKIDRDGNQVWKQYYPQEVGSTLKAIDATDDGGAVLLLHRANTVRLIKTTPQGFILNAAEEAVAAASNITLFPNPTNTNRITLTFPKPFAGTLQVFDQAGKRWMEKTVTRTSHYPLNLPETIPPGLYHLRLCDGLGTEQAVRFVKQ